MNKVFRWSGGQFAQFLDYYTFIYLFQCIKTGLQFVFLLLFMSLFFGYSKTRYLHSFKGYGEKTHKVTNFNFKTKGKTNMTEEVPKVKN